MEYKVKLIGGPLNGQVRTLPRMEVVQRRWFFKTENGDIHEPMYLYEYDVTKQVYIYKENDENKTGEVGASR